MADGDTWIRRRGADGRCAGDRPEASATMALPLIPRVLEGADNCVPHFRQHRTGDAGPREGDGYTDRTSHPHTDGGRDATSIDLRITPPAMRALGAADIQFVNDDRDESAFYGRAMYDVAHSSDSASCPRIFRKSRGLWSPTARGFLRRMRPSPR